MSQMRKSKLLTKLEAFFLVAGIIGLIADAVTLSSLFSVSKAMTTDSSQQATSSWIPVWLLSFFCIVYTSIALCFYIRRLLLRRHRKSHSSWDDEKIDTGVMLATLVVVCPMLFTYFILALSALSRIKPEYLDALLADPNEPPDHAGVLVDFSIQGFILSVSATFIIATIIFFVTRGLYRAFVSDEDDISYVGDSA